MTILRPCPEGASGSERTMSIQRWRSPVQAAAVHDLEWLHACSARLIQVVSNAARGRSGKRSGEDGCDADRDCRAVLHLVGQHDGIEIGIQCGDDGGDLECPRSDDGG